MRFTNGTTDRLARWLVMGMLVGPLCAPSSSSANDNPSVKITSTPPSGSVSYASAARWYLSTASGESSSYDEEFGSGISGSTVVAGMRNTMNLFGEFVNDATVSGNTVTVATAVSGTFTASWALGLSMELPNPCPLPPGTTPILPVGAVPPPCPYCPGGGVVIIYLSDINGVPSPAGGIGDLTVRVDIDGFSVFGNASFTSATMTNDILADLDAVFSQEPLPAGAHYGGIANGTPFFYTDDPRPLAISFQFNSVDDLNIASSAAIYYPSDLVDVPTGSAPTRFALTPPSPNPFRSSTSLSVDVPTVSEALRVDVYDLTGRRVVTLADGPRDAGRYAFSWDGNDDRGQRVAAGVYMIRARERDRAQERRIILLP